MNNDFDLPENRPLPPHVRDRMLSSVRREINEPPTRSMRTPLSIAAAVAVLAGGAFVVTGVVGNEGERLESAAGDHALDQHLTSTAGDRDLDRCWAAVEAEGKTAEYPDRSTWQAMGDQPLHLTHVTVIRADAQTFFCETSATSVAVSAPTTPVDQQVSGAMATPGGTVVGYAPESVTAVTVWSEGLESGDPLRTHAVQGHGRHDHMTEVRDGVFMAELAHHDITGLEFTATVYPQDEADSKRKTSGTPIPVPDPLVYVVDRPADEGDDALLGDEHRTLDSCLEGPGGDAGGAVVDAATWRTGATLDHHVEASTEGTKSTEAHDVKWRVFVNDRATAVCRVSPVWHFSAHSKPDELTSAEQPIATVTGENHSPGFSVVGVTTADIAGIELRHGNVTETVAVRERTFAATLDTTGDVPVNASNVTVVAYDADGNVVHEGRLPDIPKQ